jgi:hypothetical protein
MGSKSTARVFYEGKTKIKTISYKVEYDARFYEKTNAGTISFSTPTISNNTTASFEVFNRNVNTAAQITFIRLVEKANLYTATGLLQVPEPCTFVKIKNIVAYDADNKLIPNLGSTDLKICYAKQFVSAKDAILPETSVSIMPNPFEDYLIFRNEIDKTMSIQIFDVAGRTMQSIKLLPNNTQNLNTSDFQKGIYFIKCSDGKQFFTKKMIK